MASSAKVRRANVRVLAATHQDLEEKVREGTFRQDLFFRLAHLPIVVPPLRARGGDILELFEADPDTDLVVIDTSGPWRLVYTVIGGTVMRIGR